MKSSIKVLITGILLAAALTACSSGGESEKVDTTSKKTEEAAPKAEAKAEPKETDNLKVGDSVKSGNFQITLNSAVRNAATENDFPEKDNTNFIVVDLNVKNVGSKDEDPSNLILTLKDADGNVYSQTYSTAEKSQWADATLNSLPTNDQFKAQTSFEVPTSMTKDFRLQIENGVETGGRVIYNIGELK